MVGGARDWMNHKLIRIGGLRQPESNSSRSWLRRLASGRRWRLQTGTGTAEVEAKAGADKARAAMQPSARRCVPSASLDEWVYTRWVLKASILHTYSDFVLMGGGDGPLLPIGSSATGCGYPSLEVMILHWFYIGPTH